MLHGDPDKHREWQERSARRYADRRREKQSTAALHSVDNRKRKTRNDGPWRKEVMATYGERCRSCGSTRWVQADHIWPRSQGGPSVVENGLPLCRECHDAKTASRLLIQWSWLEDAQIAWLASVGWVAWDQAGQPYGRGCRHFAPKGGAEHGQGR